MAERTPLYMDINDEYSGDELGLPYRDIVSEGVVGDSLEVTQTGTPSLSVNIAAGAAWVLGDTDPTFQPCYRVLNDAVVNRGISPDPSNPRKVLVVAQVNDEAFAGTGRDWALVAIHGTPAGSPTLPALPDSALPLAEIDVAAAATEIVTGDITDLRAEAALALGGAGLTTVTSLPSSPSDGQEVVLVDSLTAPTYAWRLMYVAGISDDHKWVFLGGTGKRGASGMSVPNAGFYELDISAPGVSTAANDALGMQLSAGGITLTARAGAGGGGTQSAAGSFYDAGRTSTALSAAATLTLTGLDDGVPAGAEILLTPMRIS